MIKPIFAFFAVALITLAGIASAGQTENEIIRLSLERKDGKFDIVTPTTEYWLPAVSKQYNLEWIKKGFEEKGIYVRDLVEKLYDTNSKKEKLSVKSEPNKGYLVDYDLKFRQYFEAGPSGYSKLEQEHPNASCFITVSLPVYNPQSKLALIYKKMFCEPGGGVGVIEAFKYDGGRLEKIGSFGVLSLDR